MESINWIEWNLESQRFLFAATVEQNKLKSRVQMLSKGGEEVNWGQGIATLREKNTDTMTLLKNS